MHPELLERPHYCPKRLVAYRGCQPQDYASHVVALIDVEDATGVLHCMHASVVTNASLWACSVHDKMKKRWGSQNERVAVKRHKRRLRSQYKAHRRRFALSCSSEHLPSQRRCWMLDGTRRRQRWEIDSELRPVPVVLTAPEHFGLLHETRRKRLLRFLAALKRLTRDARKCVRIDFTRTNRMFPEGTLLFAAELDMILSTSGRGSVRCNRSIDRIVDQVLQHLGLYAKMRQRCNTPIEADNVKFWIVKTDTQVDGSHTESIINEYKEHFSHKDSQRLYDGLTEAMTNAKQHAYATKKASSREPRWWMFSQLKDSKLSVSFCDLGIGFRQSLLSGENFAIQAVVKAVDAIGGRRDGNFIKAAFELGKSRTKKRHRGKGLQELREVIESVKGQLRILSHGGMYFYDAADKREEILNFEDAVPGTVISWQVPLAKST